MFDHKDADFSCDSGCKFYELFEKSPEAMFFTSRDGYFIDVNESMAKLLGYERKDLIGARVEKTYDVEKERDSYIKYIEEKGAAEDYEITLKTSDGKNLFCLVNAVIWKEKGNIAGYYGTIRTKNQIVKSFLEYFNKLRDERKHFSDSKKNRINDMMLLMRYGSDELMDHVLKTGRNPMESGRKKITVLFFDIIGSTSIAEKLDPEVFTSFLSDIFIDIMDLIYGNHGSVNKLLGDGLMATFGVPLDTGNDALNAVNTAKQIEDYLNTYNDVKPDFMENDLRGGIGIATGYVFAGIIGSVRWEEYTVLGDTVNVAARLEKMTRKINRNILMDETTYNEVKEHYPDVKTYRSQVRGKAETMKLFSI